MVVLKVIFTIIGVKRPVMVPVQDARVHKPINDPRTLVGKSSIAYVTIPV